MQIPITKEERKAEFKEFAQEFHLVPENSLTGRTISIENFAKKYCNPHGKDWVKTNILYKFEPEWCPDIHPGVGHGFTIFEKPAAEWMEEHRKEINWNTR